MNAMAEGSSLFGFSIVDESQGLLKTGRVFYQSRALKVRDAFAGFAAGHVLSLFVGGPLVDRIGARRSLSYGLIPIFCGMLVLSLLGALLAEVAAPTDTEAGRYS
ncbi:hypothetical protein [Marinobacter zhanjiangensis]|uniref:Major facilitator superfamily (MFS) profile domain-containing protein n=1 Tax=Marinobacter zhanjiangensis TaxID=578215 RepID=A0ABQ3B056_9GAMM|nr:hypothetical protein [Marinobacter zhanjiangensis]GGY72159.1 hypothetical protein GCM10007071_19020 [Marinobacter zhanjiangensis]